METRHNISRIIEGNSVLAITIQFGKKYEIRDGIDIETILV